jgi:hypothetical protein
VVGSAAVCAFRFRPPGTGSKRAALPVGFVIAHPMNWWLVANRLKHGMMTVRPAGVFGTMHDHGADAGARDAPHVAHDAAMEAKPAPRPAVPVMALVSFAALAAGLAIASAFGPG